jgi:hypothetical protein
MTELVLYASMINTTNIFSAFFCEINKKKKYIKKREKVMLNHKVSVCLAKQCLSI